jgi:hypothetical protein
MSSAQKSISVENKMAARLTSRDVNGGEAEAAGGWFTDSAIQRLLRLLRLFCSGKNL